MIPPNDMPADTELREQVHAIILKTDDYMKFCAIQDMPWNRSGNLLDELMQLIKARDAAIRKAAEERGFAKGYSECMKEWQTS